MSELVKRQDVENFIKTACTKNNDEKISGPALYSSFEEYCKGNGFDNRSLLSRKRFYKTVVDLGFTREGVGEKAYFADLSLVETPDAMVN